MCPEILVALHWMTEEGQSFPQRQIVSSVSTSYNTSMNEVFILINWFQQRPDTVQLRNLDAYTQHGFTNAVILQTFEQGDIL